MAEQKNISLREKVYEQLKELRDELGFASFNDTILHLLRYAQTFEHIWEEGVKEADTPPPEYFNDPR